jgi:copper chaperone CopZ
MKWLSILLLPLLLSSTQADEQRTYIIEGMSCSGCAFSVESALKRIGISKNRIVEIDYGKKSPQGSIGHIKLSFSGTQYEGLETDCKIIRAIDDYSGYVAYFDPENKKPCVPSPSPSYRSK